MRDNVLDQQPVDKVCGTNRVGDPREQLLVTFGIFPFENPCGFQCRLLSWSLVNELELIESHTTIQGQRRIHRPHLSAPSSRFARLRRRGLMVGRGQHRPVALELSHSQFEGPDLHEGHAFHLESDATSMRIKEGSGGVLPGFPATMDGAN